MYDIDKMPSSIDVGYTGETNFNSIEINMAPWVSKSPGGSPKILYMRPGESEASLATTTFEDNILTWTITDDVLGTREGTGLFQVWFADTDEEEELRKLGMSVVVSMIIHLSIAGEGGNASTVQLPWLKEIMDLKNIILGYDYEAEAWAVGQSGGVDVPSTNPAYNNHAKHYSEEAAKWATGGTTGTPGAENNAKYYSEQADAAKAAAQTAQAACEAEVTRQLSEIISNPDSPPLDRTLSSNVSAAPADMVGNLKSALTQVDDKQIVIIDALADENEMTPSATETGKIMKADGTEDSSGGSSWQYKKYDVSNIEIVHVTNARILYTYTPTVVFKDSSNNVISAYDFGVSSPAFTADKRYPVPSNAKWAFVNTVNRGSYPITVYNSALAEHISKHIGDFVDMHSEYEQIYSTAENVENVNSWGVTSPTTKEVSDGKIKFTFTKTDSNTRFWNYIRKPTTISIGDKIKCEVWVKILSNSCTRSDNIFELAVIGYTSSSVKDEKYVTSLVEGNTYRFSVELTTTNAESDNTYFAIGNTLSDASISIEIERFNIMKVVNTPYNGEGQTGVQYADYANALTKTGLKQVANYVDRFGKFSGKTWFAVGDSLTADYFDLYVSFVEDKTGMTATNYGVGGTSVSPATGISNDFVSRVQNINGNADLWTIFGGQNDCAAVRRAIYDQEGAKEEIGTIDSTDTNTFYGAYNTIIQNILARTGNPVIVLIFPYYTRNSVDPTETDIAKQRIREAVLALGVKYGLPVIDLYSISQINANNYSKYLRDGTHPSQDGANLLRPLILEQFAQKVNFAETTPNMPH